MRDVACSANIPAQGQSGLITFSDSEASPFEDGFHFRPYYAIALKTLSERNVDTLQSMAYSRE